MSRETGGGRWPSAAIASSTPLAGDSRPTNSSRPRHGRAGSARAGKVTVSIPLPTTDCAARNPRRDARRRPQLLADPDDLRSGGWGRQLRGRIGEPPVARDEHDRHPGRGHGAESALLRHAGEVPGADDVRPCAGDCALDGGSRGGVVGVGRLGAVDVGQLAQDRERVEVCGRVAGRVCGRAAGRVRGRQHGDDVTGAPPQRNDIGAGPLVPAGRRGRVEIGEDEDPHRRPASLPGCR